MTRGRTTPGPTRSHAVRSVKRAKQFLASYDLSQERQQAILHAILAHSYRHGTRTATLEARVLYDADRWRCAWEPLGYDHEAWALARGQDISSR